MERETKRPLFFDQQDALCGWQGEDGAAVMLQPDMSGRALAFSGIQVVSRRIFEYMADEKSPFSSIATYMKAARAGEKISACLMKEYWIDVGTVEKLEVLRSRLEHGKKS